MRHHNLIIAVAASAFLATACTRVDVPSDALAVVREFGVVQPAPLGPGLHFIGPFENAELVTMSFVDLNFTQDATTTGPNANSEEQTIFGLTKDGLTIEVPVSVNWAVSPQTLTLVKARLPGHYTDREYVIIRSAVRDAIAEFGVRDGSIFDRSALQTAITNHIKSQTVAYYAAQDFGANSDNIVRYGLITVRGVFPSNEIVAKREKVITAELDALASAARTKVPSDRSVHDYTKVIEAQAVAKAADDGKANVTIITGNTPAAAVVTGPK